MIAGWFGPFASGTGVDGEDLRAVDGPGPQPPEPGCVGRIISDHLAARTEPPTPKPAELKPPKPKPAKKSVAKKPKPK